MPQERRRGEVMLALLFVLYALLLTGINPPLMRFTHQDLLWNDLVLAGRTAWGADAWRGNPLATIDFLHGLGIHVRSDIKIQPHLYDPAVLLALVTGIPVALWLRSFLLFLYCLFSLNLLWRQQHPPGAAAAPENPLRLPLILFYVVSPTLFNEISHHFSATFLTLPGVVASARALLHRRDVKAQVAFVVASLLFISTSDVHIAIFALVMFGVIVFVDPVNERVPWGLIVCAGVAFAVLLGAEYSGFAYHYLYDRAHYLYSVANAANLAGYWHSFLENHVVSVFFSKGTEFSPYIGHYLVVLLAVWLVGGRVKGVRRVLAMVVALLALGAVLHGVPALRKAMPSTVRYHLTIIPFMVSLLLMFRAGEVQAGIVRFRERRWSRRGLVVAGVLAILVVQELASYGSAAAHLYDPDSALGGVGSDVARTLLFAAYLPIGVVFPVLFALLALYAPLPSLRTFRGAAAAVTLVLAIPLLIYSERGIKRHVFVSHDLYQALFNDVPRFVSDTLDASPYRALPRSIVPVARGLVPGVKEGINDKMLPIIEMPERFGGRSFAQWRYSTTRHMAAQYEAMAGGRTLRVHAALPDRVGAAIDFAQASRAPFILSADAALDDPRLERLGSHTVPAALVAHHKQYREGGMVGTFRLYAVRPVVADGLPFEHVAFGRTSVRFTGLRADAPARVRLPYTRLAGMVATDGQGRALPLAEDDGYAAIANDGSVRDVVLTSRSWIAAVPLLGPLLAWLALWLGLRLVPRRRTVPTP